MEVQVQEPPCQIRNENGHFHKLAPKPDWRRGAVAPFPQRVELSFFAARSRGVALLHNL